MHSTRLTQTRRRIFAAAQASERPRPQAQKQRNQPKANQRCRASGAQLVHSAWLRRGGLNCSAHGLGMCAMGYEEAARLGRSVGEQKQGTRSQWAAVRKMHLRAFVCGKDRKCAHSSGLHASIPNEAVNSSLQQVAVQPAIHTLLTTAGASQLPSTRPFTRTGVIAHDTHPPRPPPGPVFKLALQSYC